MPIPGLDGSQVCSSSVVKLLTPTGGETKRREGSGSSAERRSADEKPEGHQNRADIRGTVEVKGGLFEYGEGNDQLHDRVGCKNGC